jgi:ketosteroid isomerase-like protein
MNRDQMLETIDALYEIRIAGLTDPMREYVAEGATFRLAGEGQAGDVAFLDAMGGLNASIMMHRVDRRTAVAEGNRCALHLVVDVAFPGGEPFETELLNLWTFDEAGKVASLIEFVDTARLAHEVKLMGRAVF